MTQQQKATLFRNAHLEKGLILPNAWNAVSAKLIELSGAAAIATTSAGVSWSKGYKDGESLGRVEMLHSLREIVAVTSLPVTVDIESGYGDGSKEDVAETTKLVLDSGAIGINLEDSSTNHPGGLLKPVKQAERIQEARRTAISAGIDLFINARIDIYLAGIGDADSNLDAVLERAHVYLDAGADGIFVPGLSGLETIRALTDSLNAPLNIMAAPTSHSVQQLVGAGVSRISLGPHLALSAYGLVQKMTKEVLNSGTYHSFQTDLSFSELNNMFSL